MSPTKKKNGREDMIEDNTTTTPYYAMGVFCTCMYPHLRKGLIPNLTQSYIDLEILGSISQGNEFCYQRNLEDIIGISHASIVNILKEMEAKGLIKRSTTEDNKRDKIVSMTKKGEEVLAWHLDRMERYEKILYDGISKEELELHAKITWKMSNNLMDASKREFRNMPSFDEFRKENGANVPTVMNSESQDAFLKMIRCLKEIELEMTKE